jgi:hypothetical protein
MLCFSLCYNAAMKDLCLLGAAEMLVDAGYEVPDVDKLRSGCTCGWQTRTMDIGFPTTEPKTIVKRHWNINCPSHGIKTA